MCGHGLVSDLVLTGRILSAEEALGHGDREPRRGPRRPRHHRPRRWPRQIAAAPAVTVKMAREVIRHLAVPQIRSSMADEMIYQTFVNRSDDAAERRAAAAEGREPRYTGS